MVCLRKLKVLNFHYFFSKISNDTFFSQIILFINIDYGDFILMIPNVFLVVVLYCIITLINIVVYLMDI